jgi:hypothetical protein
VSIISLVSALIAQEFRIPGNILGARYRPWAKNIPEIYADLNRI